MNESNESSPATPPRLPRRWFSLRVMLAVMILSGVWLASWAAAHRAKERAVARLEEFGADVVFDYQSRSASDPRLNRPRGNPVLRRMLGKNYASDVVEVHLFVSTLMTPEKFTDADADLLLGLPAIEVLTLYHTQLTDVGLMKLTELPALERLDVEDTQVTAQGVKDFKLARPSVKILASVAD